MKSALAGATGSLVGSLGGSTAVGLKLLGSTAAGIAQAVVLDPLEEVGAAVEDAAHATMDMVVGAGPEGDGDGAEVAPAEAEGTEGARPALGDISNGAAEEIEAKVAAR